ncbi:MAG TPA: hypothetical protein VJ302_28905 [Blastocatellia bacterium]|nr:hypothetical protein [Blastocatellia bacterium]
MNHQTASARLSPVPGPSPLDVLILASPLDTHARTGSLKLIERGLTVLIVDFADFPERAGLSVRHDDRGSQTLLEYEGRTYLLNGLRSIWLRKIGISEARPGNGLYGAWARQELNRFITDALENIGCFWFPGSRTSLIRLESKRSRMLSLAQNAGFRIPPTLTTHRIEDLLAFYEEHEGNIVAKKFYQSMLPGYYVPEQVDQRAHVCFTRPVTILDLRYLHHLTEAPVIFQVKVPKKVELRVTVVGRKIFAAAINSQDTHRTKNDWRHYDHSNTQIEIYELPEEIVRSCLRLVEAMGVRYGAIDLIETPDGEIYFLEINPAGQSHWIEEQTGLPITEEICMWLSNPAGT